ncbi:MAG: Hsp70 family protein [Ahrensia sp.]|nr:Hsp70 family protein [Ahrensia sp.]
MAGQLVDTLAIDFGTSNSAAAIMTQDGIERIAVEAGAETLPTAVFFPLGEPMLIGQEASNALIERYEGRYMRALKSVLGLDLLHEPTLIGGSRQTLADIICAFLSQIKQRAEQQAGRAFKKVLSGRPVRFHSDNPDRDRRALADLTACYRAAGFEQVDFLPEPEAAALAAHDQHRAEGLGLVVDIGGGTSDFCVFRNSGGAIDILASYGIRLGGTDFDRLISLAHAMPQLGLGGMLRREMQSGLLPVPRRLYADLATWSHIPFLYSAKVKREVEEMVRLALQPRIVERLLTLIEDQSGHALAFAVEAAKIDVNTGARAGAVDMGFIEPGLVAPLTPETMDETLDENRRHMRSAADSTLARAGVDPADISSIVLVGGSSLMGLVSQEMRTLCPRAEFQQARIFTAVVDGLALATRH